MKHAIALFLLAVLAASAAGAAPAGSPTDRWYVLLMDGHRAGWMVERERSEGGRVITENESHMTFRRDATEMSISIRTRFVETERGEPIEMWSRTVFGGTPTEEHARFGPDGITVTRTQNGIDQTKTVPPPAGRWLPPAAAARYLAGRLAAGAEKIVVRSIDPSAGIEPVTTTRSGFETTTVEVMGRSVAAEKCISESSAYPGIRSVEYLDPRGRLLKSDVRIGAWNMTILAADKPLALSPLDAPELMRSVFVEPDRKINDPFDAVRCSLVVSVAEGVLPDLPSTGSQRVERLDDRAARLVRDLRADPVGEAGPVDTAALTAPTLMLTCDDPRVKELAGDALAGVPADKTRRAEALRRFVHRYIRSKDLSVGFASAAEVARTRRGDCTEHAVLLAALLRSDGIPSRVVSGLIYAPRFAGERDIFAYHMWAQAYLERDGGPAWVDLDATLPDSVPITAAHVALTVSELPDSDRINALVELAPLMGRLRIHVEDVE